MRQAIGLARRGYGTTSPNPMVGAVLVKGGKIAGRSWHRRTAGLRARKSPPFTPCAGWVVCMTGGLA
ncbi:MAG: hypothetical protein ABSC89_01430 [Verrucomicrobiota bacterium]